MFAKIVSFQEVLNLTLLSNKELKAKKLEVQRFKESIDEVDGHKLGKLEFIQNISRTNNAGYVFGMKLASREASFADFGFAEFLSHTPSPMDSSVLDVKPRDLNNPEARNNVETKVTYEAPLFTGYKLENAKSMAQLQFMATKAKYLYDQKQIGLEVLKAYNGAVAAKKFIEMTKKAKIVANRFVKTSQDLYNNKLVRMLDIKQAKMAKFSINTKLEEAKTKFKLAIAYLQFLASDASISDVKDFAMVQVDVNSLNTLQENAIAKRDDLKWMQYNTETMKRKISYESSNKYPTIGTHLEYGINDDKLTVSSQKDYYLAAIGLRYNLFDGDISSIQRQKAKIDYAKTKHYFEYMKDGIDLEVKKNFLDYITLSNSLKDKIQLSKMSKDILKETENIYKNNLKFRTNMIYLLMSLENMLKAQADVINAQYETTISSAKLKLSVGKSLQAKGN
jgi:outer membrane protein TolC